MKLSQQELDEDIEKKKREVKEIEEELNEAEEEMEELEEELKELEHPAEPPQHAPGQKRTFCPSVCVQLWHLCRQDVRLPDVSNFKKIFAGATGACWVLLRCTAFACVIFGIPELHRRTHVLVDSFVVSLFIAQMWYGYKKPVDASILCAAPALSIPFMCSIVSCTVAENYAVYFGFSHNDQGENIASGGVEGEHSDLIITTSEGENIASGGVEGKYTHFSRQVECHFESVLLLFSAGQNCHFQRRFLSFCHFLMSFFVISLSTKMCLRVKGGGAPMPGNSMAGGSMGGSGGSGGSHGSSNSTPAAPNQPLKTMADMADAFAPIAKPPADPNYAIQCTVLFLIGLSTLVFGTALRMLVVGGSSSLFKVKQIFPYAIVYAVWIVVGCNLGLMVCLLNSPPISTKCPPTRNVPQKFPKISKKFQKNSKKFPKNFQKSSKKIPIRIL